MKPRRNNAFLRGLALLAMLLFIGNVAADAVADLVRAIVPHRLRNLLRTTRRALARIVCAQRIRVQSWRRILRQSLGVICSLRTFCRAPMQPRHLVWRPRSIIRLSWPDA